MRVVDAPFESTFPHLNKGPPGVVRFDIVVIFVRRVLERARLALDDVHEVFQLLEADGPLAAAADGEGIFMVEGRGRGG